MTHKQTLLRNEAIDNVLEDYVTGSGSMQATESVLDFFERCESNPDEFWEHYLGYFSETNPDFPKVKAVLADLGPKATFREFFEAMNRQRVQ